MHSANVFGKIRNHAHSSRARRDPQHNDNCDSRADPDSQLFPMLATRRLDQLRVNKVPRLGRLEGKAQHALFQLAIRHGKPIVLPLMFSPGIHYKTFQIAARNFRIIKNASA